MSNDKNKVKHHTSLYYITVSIPLTCTIATPVNSRSRETHWTLDRDFLSISTLNKAVVRIFSW